MKTFKPRMNKMKIVTPTVNPREYCLRSRYPLPGRIQLASATKAGEIAGERDGWSDIRADTVSG